MLHVLRPTLVWYSSSATVERVLEYNAITLIEQSFLVFRQLTPK